MKRILKTSVVLALAVIVAMSVGSAAFGAKPVKPPAAPSTTAVFKLIAERSLKVGEDPALAVADASKKIMTYIDKSGGSWKVIPNGNAPDGRSLKMPSPGPGMYIQIVEVYSPSVDGCMITAEGGKMSVMLPWEYAIYTDGSGKIRVNMLAPTGVIQLMADDPTCVASAAKQAEDNLSKFAATALGKGWTFPQAYMEPKLTAEEVAMARSMTFAPEVAITVPKNADAAVFTRQVRDSVAASINARAPIMPQGWHVTRVVDFTGGAVANTYSLELCSSYYASQALGMGPHHAPALPCQVGVWYDGSVVRVSVLDPNFIFGFFFRDAIAQMTPEQLEMFAQLPQQVMFEICDMVNEGISPYTSSRF